MVNGIYIFLLLNTKHLVVLIFFFEMIKYSHKKRQRKMHKTSGRQRGQSLVCKLSCSWRKMILVPNYRSDCEFDLPKWQSPEVQQKPLLVACLPYLIIKK